MINVYIVAAFWFLSALVSTIIANRLKISNALMEIIIGANIGFIGATLIAYLILNWGLQSSLITGIALSTTSMAVVYAVMIEYGFNKTSFGKSILGACFVNDLGIVIGLGLIFAPFTYKTLIFIAVTVLLIANKFFLPDHLLEKPVLDDQMPDIIKERK
jgi:Kef-type K+ transport system membrane component KefB